MTVLGSMTPTPVGPWAGQASAQIGRNPVMSGGEIGCLAWPGLAEAGLSGGNKMDSPKAGTRFFSPLRDIRVSRDHNIREI